MDHSRWPMPLLQPESHTGCMEHSVAYLCRVFGRTDVTAADVTHYRQQSGKIETLYPVVACGVQRDHFWQDYDADEARELHKRYWMGPQHRPWVEEHLQAGHLALVHVLRIRTLGHVAVLLDADAQKVLLMDPLMGFVEEPWDWFLGPGAGTNCHHIDGWFYRRDG